MDKELYKRIRELRIKYGYNSMQAFADALGTHINTVKGWERKNNPVLPGLDNLLQMCDLFDCDLDYLVDRMEETKHDIHSVHEFTGLSEKAIRKMAPPGLHPNADSPAVRVLNHLIESDSFSDFVAAYGSFLVAAYRLKEATIPEATPYPVDKDGAYVIDGSTRSPEGANTVIDRDTVTLRIDEYAQWSMDQAAKALMRLCEEEFQESYESCKRNSRQRKHTVSNKDRRHE